MNHLTLQLGHTYRLSMCRTVRRSMESRIRTGYGQRSEVFRDGRRAGTR